MSVNISAPSPSAGMLRTTTTINKDNLKLSGTNSELQAVSFFSKSCKSSNKQKLTSQTQASEWFAAVTLLHSLIVSFPCMGCQSHKCFIFWDKEQDTWEWWSKKRRKSTLQLNILIDILKMVLKGFKINVNNHMHQRAQAEQYLSLFLLNNKV